jgi:hypothetical protein
MGVKDKMETQNKQERLESKLEKLQNAIEKRYGGEWYHSGMEGFDWQYKFRNSKKVGEDSDEVYVKNSIRVYSSRLKFQYMADEVKSHYKERSYSFKDGDGCYRDAPGWGGHSAG